jgi:lipopolysaccharide biosynthesis glycosyltransferase
VGQPDLDVVFSVDHLYAEAAIVTGRSIRVGLAGRPVDVRFHVIDAGLDRASRQRLEAALRRMGDADIYSVPGRLRLAEPRNYYTSAILGRLHAGNVLPGDIERVVYLDADTLVLDDLTKLYGLDLGESPLGAVLADNTPRHWMNHPALLERCPRYAGNPPDYFNSGVLLIDLAKWRSDNVTEQAVQLFHRFATGLICPDQEILNVIFADRFTRLPKIWNKLIEHHQYGKFGRGRIDYLTRREGIVHYGGEIKPWHGEFPRNPLRDLYQEFSSAQVET